MDLDDFRGLARQLWDDHERITRPAMGDVWRPLIEPLVHNECWMALLQHAQTKTKAPTPEQFKRIVLETRSQSTGWKPDDNYYEKRCDGCFELNRYDKETNVIWESDGGLVFRERPDGWYAARCRDCRGPRVHYASPNRGDNYLPIPRLDEREAGLWKPWTETPLKDLLRPTEPKRWSEAWNRWWRAAIERTQQWRQEQRA